LLLPEVEVGDQRPDQHQISVSFHQAFGGELGEVDRLADATPLGGGGGDTEQVGDGSGAEEGGPETSHRRLCRFVTHGGAVDEQGPHPGARPGSGPEPGRRHDARGWRGIHLDGRTGISTEFPGRRGGHTRLISNNSSWVQETRLRAAKQIYGGSPPVARSNTLILIRITVSLSMSEPASGRVKTIEFDLSRSLVTTES